MAIPIKYNFRNLKLRKGLTIMTALGIALTVTTAVFLMALLAGLNKAFIKSGDSLNVLALRKGSQAELSGGFDASLFPTLKELPGVAKDSKGEPLASGEWVVVIVLPRKDGTGDVNVSVRGMWIVCARKPFAAAHFDVPHFHCAILPQSPPGREPRTPGLVVGYDRCDPAVPGTAT